MTSQKEMKFVALSINGKISMGFFMTEQAWQPDMEGRKRGRRKCVREGRILCMFV
jgi:hypothetical protein